MRPSGLRQYRATGREFLGPVKIVEQDQNIRRRKKIVSILSVYVVYVVYVIYVIYVVSQ